MEELKKLIEAELGYLPEGNGMDTLLSRAELVTYKNKDVLIEVGTCNPDVFIVKSGIIRMCDMDGDKERTISFALPGTIFMSKHSFVMGLPSYCQVEACCDTEVLRLGKDAFWEAVEEDHQLALWMLRYANGELFYQEHKSSKVHNGSAQERFEAMMKDRPMIIEKVSQKTIASYLGVTPQYYCQLKRKYLKKY